jgi:hypothetical protein
MDGGTDVERERLPVKNDKTHEKSFSYRGQ